MRLLFRQSIIALLLLVLLPLAAPVAAQEDPPDLRTYTGWLRAAFAAAQRFDQLGLEQVASQLTATTAVRLPDGSTIPVDNSWLAAALDQPQPNLPQITARLGTLLDLLAQPAAAASPNADQRLQAILANPPFESVDRGASWIGQFFDWLFRWLGNLLEPVNAAGAEAASPVSTIFALLGSVLLLAVLVYLALSLRRSLARPVAVDDEEHDPEANLTATTALQQAGSLAQGGDYRTAVRYLYLSSLLWLDERGVMRYDRALTNREHLNRLPADATLHAHLQPIVETFDQVWYGNAPLDAAGFAAYKRQVEALRKVRPNG